jgi:beta-1,4-mannooligosaccharide/beta-1,4-mannosyl-N-acetylglucosamine phosphorylase
MSEGACVRNGSSLPGMPWQERPEGGHGVMWRCDANPVIPADLLPCSNSIFNSAVVPYDGAYAGVFRVDNRAWEMCLHAGFSDDGLAWRLDEEPIRFLCDDPDPEAARMDYGYDPRVVWLEDRFYVHWCTGYHGPTIGVGWTQDFRTFHKLENAFLPYNRNGVLFPRRIGGDYVMLSRPSDTGHTAFGDMFLSRSPDMVHWGRHRHVMGPTGGWQRTKIGPGPCPIETDQGWLLIYHGVLTSCNGFIYSIGVALLDLDEPWKVLGRGRSYILSPHEIYERAGDVPNVCFPCAALVDADTGRLALYYGAADTTVCLAFAHVDELVSFALEGR